MVYPKLIHLFISFLKLGFTAFGGPAMVAYIKELAVEKKKWLDGKTFQEGIALAQAIPGATAMQVAAYVGLKTRGIIGGIASFTAFGLPAFLFVLILSYFYAKTHTIPEVISVFTGLQVIVVAIVANAFLSFAKPVIKSKGETVVAIFSFLLFLLKINPFLIIIACFILSQLIFRDKTGSDNKNAKKINLRDILPIFFIVFAGLLFLYLFDKTLFNISLIMMKIDFFAFGGGYASLPLMLHEFVDRLHWIDGKTFMDGIALGQITPGPIVITATFVGYLLKGLAGATVATISIFTPSFIMMAFASEISEKIRDSNIFIRAKRGLLASFSGLLLFATIKFAQSVDWNWLKILIVSISFFALFKRVNILYIVITGAVISVFLFN
ncbi:MAG: chromate efflux transporter [Thermodesulfovibrio sp.]|uniref:chromate efflux transporter n=1 Tax=unclassified Thermodesulfovibrio TaxID=2645936 RepID=UPI00083B2213|nr:MULTISPECIES: chromate efflux transporter [unclassified Thermodesulfovibrio]MDI1471100.1 chromate efflux transporter [Thermodesulfovibrio sp. 1176]MDI6713950.1 chromate efflux transporter [Thermodesulfovibrio sp.]ODA44364.1 Chromate transport protein [Thermodesulfovibrio sp. N1]